MDELEGLLSASPLVIDADDDDISIIGLDRQDDMRFNGKASDPRGQFWGVATDIRELAETHKRGVELGTFPIARIPTAGRCNRRYRPDPTPRTP